MPFRIFEIERIDIFILFRRILGVLNGAVRALPKPLPMLLDIRVVGRALEGHIQCDLESVSFGFGNEVSETLQRPQLCMYRSMSAFLRSDGPRAADIIRLSRGGVVFPLSRCAPDGMNWRKIDDIETHRCNVGEPRLAVPQSSVPSGFESTRSRKYFVPS